MPHTPHELPELFPEHAAALHALKTEDNHFGRMAERYHELNRAIHRAETDAEPTSESALEDMKKERLGLLDRIRHMLLERTGAAPSA